MDRSCDTAPIDIEGQWIWDTKDGAAEQAVTCLFRRSFDGRQIGPNPVLHISADSRYRAYLNGRLISRGPCRGTPEYYHYESVDLAPYLRDGSNVLAVEVRWYGRGFEPRAEAHLTPGLWAMIASDTNPTALTTDGDWKVLRSPGHRLRPIPRNHPVSGWYHVIDPIEDLDLREVPPDWRETDYDDSAWPNALPVRPARGRYQAKTWYFAAQELIPRAIPLMEETPVLPARVHQFGTLAPASPPQDARQIDGLLSPVDGTTAVFWGDHARPLILDGTGTHYVILDMGKLFTGYPRLTLAAPAGTMAEFRYSEALSCNYQKGVRDDPAGTVEGYYDLFTCCDGQNVVEPFVWRTFRFLRVAVHHPNGSATLERLETIFTAYPFHETAAFESSDPLHKKIWDTSWLTARLCAHEHYEDCPYYEQVQYVVDTWLQSLASFLVTGDFRLARQALRQFAQSRRSDGITMGRAPAVAWEPVIIPNLSLAWIEYLEDYYRYSGDISLIQELWDCVESVLRWFEQFTQDGLLDNVPYWCFTDWTLPFNARHICGSTGELNMKWIGALRAAARLAHAQANTERARYLASQSQTAAEAVKGRFWNSSAGLFNDELDETLVAEHASIYAILYDVVDPRTGREIVKRLGQRTDLARTSIAYTYFTFRAYEKLGLYDQAWTGRLHNWTDQLALHATTWFETREPSRSDCHGWGSWIMTEFLTTILGITPAAPGFAKVRIAPHLLALDRAKGSIPTVRGTIDAEWNRQGQTVRYQVDLPASITGTLITPRGETFPLAAGRNSIGFSA